MQTLLDDASKWYEMQNSSELSSARVSKANRVEDCPPAYENIITDLEAENRK